MEPHVIADVGPPVSDEVDEPTAEEHEGMPERCYLDEEAESFAHGLCQAFQKRDLPSALMTDNGSAMRAAETQAGLRDLSIVWSPTLDYSPYQNGKQEVFWAQVEGRLLPMLEGVPDLTLAMLDEATQAWIELEYNRSVHSELGMSPIAAMRAGGKASVRKAAQLLG